MLKKKIWANFLTGSEIQDPEKTYFGSRIQGSNRHQIPDPDPQHWKKYNIKTHFFKSLVPPVERRSYESLSKLGALTVMIRGKKLSSRQVNKLAFFLIAHCLIFSHNQPFRLGRGGGCTWPGGGGMHVHPVHPPWVRHCPGLC